MSISAACRSPAARDQANGRWAAGDPNLKLEAPHGTDSPQTPRWREMDSNHWSRHGETPLGRAMWFPRTGWDQLEAALIPRGTKSSNPSCSAGSLQNAAKRLDTGKLSSGSEEDQKF